jgi:hypothetical protein
MPGPECCEHCAEISLLREEVAALRARLNALTTLPLSASEPLPLQAELDVAAKTPPRQMPLFGPVHGPPLPQVDHESSLQAKVGLYRALFAGRSDVYAYRWENTAEGTKGWAPKRRPGTTRDNPEYLPLTDEVISAHLTKENPAACGLYVTLPDSSCRLLVCDFDGGTWRLDAAAYAEAAAWAGVPAAVEISRSGDGAHVWTFFSEPVAAADARAMGAALLHEAMAIRGEMDIESYDRLFPAQDYLPRRGFGNLIALPLEGRCRQNRTTLFVDPATFEPYQDQFAYLSSLERMTRRDVVERAEELQPPTVGSAVRLHRSPLAAELPPPDVIKAELSVMLAIRRAGLPPSLLSSLKHLASLHNPEFYSRQQIGLSVWGAPRMLRCYSESLDRLFLPRGVADRAAKLIEKAGSRLAITDLRSAPAELEIEFTGTLRTEQQAAVDAVAAYELGVLVAPPGAGKTVMGCGVIARHKVPTLILVDRTPLVDQWKDRLREHLGLGPKDIGQLGGGKKTKLTGRIDLATLQSLTRAADPAAILCEYGLVIVDECHHVAAHTFARAIQHFGWRQFPAHQRGVAGELGPPPHLGALGRLFPALSCLIRGDLHHGADDRGSQRARGQPARPVQHHRLGGPGLRRVQELGSVGDDLRLVPGDHPFTEQGHGPGQLDRQVVREVQQAVHRVPGLPQGRRQLGPGELVPRLRHARRALRRAAGRGAPPDQLGDRGVLQR